MPDMAAHELFFEIFQETSSGDFGIQPLSPERDAEHPAGPIFRCHSQILNQTPGFIGKVRQYGKLLPRTVNNATVPSAKDYFKANGYAGLMEDVGFSNFAKPIEESALQSMISRLDNREDPMKPGFTTATILSGDTGARKRRDPFFLAERYEIKLDCESLAELLRFVYQGDSYFFSLRPRGDEQREVLKHKILRLCFDAEKYSVDLLFGKILRWFGTRCYEVIGERNFADAFYHLQHFEQRCTEEFARQALVKTTTGDMLASRQQFRTVTRDPRWASLPVEFVENALRCDSMPVSFEMEVLNLIERWNANADKPKEHIIRLLACFRPDEETRDHLKQWLTSMGWLRPELDGAAEYASTDLPELAKVQALVSGARGPPRHNLRGRELEEAQLEAKAEKEAKEEAKKKGRTKVAGQPEASETEAPFVHYKGASAVAQGFSFNLGSQQRLVQASSIRAAGVQRLRVVLSNPRKMLWDQEHEVFVGISYGEGRYFGFLLSATAFSGIFSVRALASASPAPNAPVHITGSGNKVEFDCALEVQLQRVNMVVTCKLCVISRNETLTEELFQVTHHTLREGPGLRYQIVATGLGDEDVDIQLGWVSGGGADCKEVAPGPMIDFA